jgi:predicted CoA-binding protein
MGQGITVVLGASPHADRYSHLAVVRLLAHGHPVVAVGNKAGAIQGVHIQRDLPQPGTVDTVTLYLNPVNQRDREDAIMALRPNRVIFNPGTENNAFADRLRRVGIEVVEGCTLVMLAARTY